MTLAGPALSEDQLELREVVRKLLSTVSRDDVRTTMTSDDGTDHHLWRRAAREVGLHGIAVPEQFGGAGAGPVELALVFEELGRSLAGGPYLSTLAMAVPALLGAGDETATADYLPGIVDGSLRATLVLNSDLGFWDPRTVPFVATEHDGCYHLRGEAGHVLDAQASDLLLVAARTDARPSLFAVAAGAAGLRREALGSLDQTRRIGRVRLDGTPGRLIGRAGGAGPVLAAAADLALVALAAEQVGGARQCLDAAVAHATERVQFGRAIGSFQAVKHRCADMLVLVESARSAAMHAAWTAEHDPAALTEVAAVAAAYCSEAYVTVATDSMRTFGGIGFTWEHDAHLYVRRALSDRVLLGSPDLHTERLAVLQDERHRPPSA